MGDYIRNGPSNDAFMKVSGIVPPVIELPNLKGCCNGWLKLSYVVSAPLHMKGLWEFWFKERRYKTAEKIAVTCDLVIHLGLWIVPLILEAWAFGQNMGHFHTKELQLASFWSLVTALIGIAIASFFALFAGGQEAGRLFPSTYALIVGGGTASAAFSFLFIQYSMQEWPAYIASNEYDDKFAILRHIYLWTLVLKILAVACLKKNAEFWGPCTTDVVKEQAEMMEQFKSNRGMTAA